MNLTYFIGEPGIGKSTLVAKLTEGWQAKATDQPFAFRTYSNGVVELGRDRELHPGTDSLSMSVQPKVLEFLAAMRYPHVLGEGDRLANGLFFQGVQRIGYRLVVYHLVGEHLADERRGRRGTDQDQAFIKGRRTKCAALAERFDAIDMYATLPPELLVKMLHDPVCSRFLK